MKNKSSTGNKGVIKVIWELDERMMRNPELVVQYLQAITQSVVTVLGDAKIKVVRE